MFENIIGQAHAVEALHADLEEGRFPPSSLFFGPAWSGKLSTALEVARVLTCRERGEWTCSCGPCRLQKGLTNPQTVLLGPRYSDVEIAASADALMRDPRPATRFLLIRAVRKLTRRFDPSVADTEDTRVKAMQERVGQLEEMMVDLDSENELAPPAKLGKMLEHIVTAAAPIAAQVRTDAISIGQVRRLAAWSHLTAGESRKIAIIENADRMQDAARNAMLKLLEEPPPSVRLVLLSTRRAAIIPTILSRLRPYPFPARSRAEEQEVMTRIFRREGAGFPDLRSFFLAWREINPEKLAQLARRFLELARTADPDTDILEEMAELFSDRSSRRARFFRESVSSFLEEMAGGMGELLRSDLLPTDTLEQWATAAREAASQVEALNMPPAAVVEALFYRLRAEAAP